MAKRSTGSRRGRRTRAEIRARVPPGLRGASPSRLIEAAAEIARRGSDLGALEVLAAALKASPRHPEGHGLRLELLRKIGPEMDLRGWLGSLRALYDRGEATPPMVLELALAEERRSALDAALDHYQEVIALAAVRAASQELLEIAHRGVARCEAALRPQDEEGSGQPPREGSGPEVGQGPGSGRATSEPRSDPSRARKEKALLGRGSMQLQEEEEPLPVELACQWSVVDARSLLARLAANEFDPLERYRLAEEAWSWGLEHLRIEPHASGASAATGPILAAGPAPAANCWVDKEGLEVIQGLRGRALLAYPNEEEGVAVALHVVRRLADSRGLRRVLVLAPAPLLPLWARDLRLALPDALLLFDAQIRAEGPNGWKDFRDQPGRATFLLVDSTGVEAHDADLEALDPQLVLVDQAQQASSPDSRLGRLTQRLAGPWLLLLSSVPVVNDLLSLHALVTLVRPGLLGTQAAFRRAHLSRSEPWKAVDREALCRTLAHAVRHLPPDRSATEASGPAASSDLQVHRLESSEGAEDGWIEEVLELVRNGKEASPGLLCCREIQRARVLVDRLEQHGIAGWTVACDTEPLPSRPLRVRLVLHLDLPSHPSLGALRGQRFEPGAAQTLLLPGSGPEPGLFALGPTACGLPSEEGAREWMRVLLRVRSTSSPLQRVRAAFEAAGPDGLEHELHALRRELDAARERASRSVVRSRALLWPQGAA